MASETNDVACRACGCTDNDCSGCVERTGAPCFWVEPDLCSACSDAQPLEIAKASARATCVRHALPGAIVAVLDQAGHLQVGLAAIDHPMTFPLGLLYQQLHEAVEGIMGVRQRGSAPAPRPPERAACIHCMQDVAGVEDLDAIRTHSMTCSKSPVVEELQRLRRIEEAAYHVAWRWENRDVAKINGTNPEQLDELARAFANCGCPNCGREHLEPFATDETGLDHGPWGCPDCTWTVGDPITSRGELLARIENLELQVREQRPLVDQAEVVARHWEAHDGINGAELDKLRDIVFDRPRGGA